MFDCWWNRDWRGCNAEIGPAADGGYYLIGLCSEASRDDFEKALEDGSAEGLVHQIPVTAGDFIFIPSGRLHAIGAGLLIFEIQQNSDTTYRVFDWKRGDLDGKARDLHISESLTSIDFDDIEPGLDQPVGPLLVECEHFRVERHAISGSGSNFDLDANQFSLITVLSGEVQLGGKEFQPGDFFSGPRKDGNPETDRSGRARRDPADDLAGVIAHWPCPVAHSFHAMPLNAAPIP